MVTQGSGRQIARLQAVRGRRDAAACEQALAAVARPRAADAPLLEPLRTALAARSTVGEVCGALRAVWGTYDAQVSDGR